MQPVGMSPDSYAAMYATTNLVNSVGGAKVTTTGHSKGGAEAVNGAYKNNLEAIVFNPAPTGPLTRLMNGLYFPSKTMDKNVQAKVVKGEAVSYLFGNPTGQNISVQSLPYKDFSTTYPNQGLYGNVKSIISSIGSRITNHGMDYVRSVLK
jgi:putative lipase involved disintegration of autophagic bodies